MSRPAKIGRWGGAGGQPYDLHRLPNPSRLVRVIIKSRDVVHSIKFVTEDSNLVPHEEGPWGGTGGDKQPVIELSDSEHIIHVSGRVGPYYNVPKVITYLKFVTNKKETFEYGNASGGTTAFDIPLEDSQVLGFFVRAGDVIDAIGFYIGEKIHGTCAPTQSPSMLSTQTCTMQSRPAKIGRWGGAGGQPYDLHRLPNPSRLVRVIIKSRDVVHSIKFVTEDSNRVPHEEGLWGGTGGDKQPVIELSDSEHIVHVSGRVGPYYDVPKVITYLKFVTNKKEPYEYGNASGGTAAFDIPLEDSQVLGFFVRAGDVIDAIGFYIGASA